MKGNTKMCRLNPPKSPKEQSVLRSKVCVSRSARGALLRDSRLRETEKRRAELSERTKVCVKVLTLVDIHRIVSDHPFITSGLSFINEKPKILYYKNCTTKQKMYILLKGKYKTLLDKR